MSDAQSTFVVFDDVGPAAAVLQRSAARELYGTLEQFRDAVRRGEGLWSQYPTASEYTKICFWMMRKLEYGFIAERFAQLEKAAGKPLRVLDVGSGVVPLAHWIAGRGHFVAAFDPLLSDMFFLSEADVGKLYGAKAHLQVARGEDLPFAMGAFDVVTCVSVLEHVPPGNDRLLLAEIARVLRPGGTLLATFDVAPVRQAAPDEPPWPAEKRRYAEPFTPPAAGRLIDWLGERYDVQGLQPEKRVAELTWDDVHGFWRHAQQADGRRTAERDYLAAGLVLRRRRDFVPLSPETVWQALLEGQEALEERRAYFELHAGKRLALLEDVEQQDAAMHSLAEALEQISRRIDVSEDTLRNSAARIGSVSEQLAARIGSVSEQLAARITALEAGLTTKLDVAATRAKAAERAVESVRVANAGLAKEVRRSFAEMTERVEAEVVGRNEQIAAKEVVIVDLDRELRTRDTAIQELDRYRRSSLRHWWLASVHKLGLWRVTVPFHKLGALVKRWSTPRLGVLDHHPPIMLDLQPLAVDAPAPSGLPRLTIVTPSFNQAGFLGRTMDSVLSQGYPHLEYIVQDGGSEDGTPALLERYRDRLFHVESKKDRGQAQAINLGFKHGSGEIMAYLNSDDLLLPGALRFVGEYFYRHPEIDVVYSHRVLIDDDNREIGRWLLPRHDSEVLSWADYIPQETLFWRRTLWEKAGASMDESFRFALDWDLLVRFRDAGAKFVRLPRFLGAFRIHEAQKTSSSIDTLGEKEMDRIRQRCHGRPVSRTEIDAAIRPYLRRHTLLHSLYRAGLVRYR